MPTPRRLPPVTRHSSHVTSGVLLILCGILFFWNLGALGLTDRDEGRNAEAGREMLETGDWMSPTFNYEPRYAKPVLVYWLMSASYKTFGVSEFAARFPSALFGLGLVLMLYLFLTRLRDANTGLLGALMLALNLQMIGLNRMALTDSVLIFFTTLSLFAFWLGFQTTRERRPWMSGLLRGHGHRDAGEGTGGIPGSSDRRRVVPVAHETVAAILAGGATPHWHGIDDSDRGALVCGHVVAPRQRLHRLGASQYRRALSQTDGRP